MEKYLSLYQGFGITFSLVFQDYTQIKRSIATMDAIIMKSPNRLLKTRFIAYYEKSFPVKLKRSGYQGRNVGFDNLKVFNGVDLYNVISANQNKNPNQLSIIDAELDVITQNYIEAKLPRVKDF